MLVEMSLAVSDDGGKGGESSVSDSSSSTTSGCWRGSGNGAKRILAEDIAMVVVRGSRGRGVWPFPDDGLSLVSPCTLR